MIDHEGENRGMARARGEWLREGWSESWRSAPALTQLRAIVNIEQEPLKNKAAWTQIPTWNKIKLKETIESCAELEGEFALAFKVVIFAAEGKRRGAVQASRVWERGPPA